MWIEIFEQLERDFYEFVMPRIGACGLKYDDGIFLTLTYDVMPRIGACGLKLILMSWLRVLLSHAPHRGMWIEMSVTR